VLNEYGENKEPVTNTVLVFSSAVLGSISALGMCVCSVSEFTLKSRSQSNQPSYAKTCS